MSRSPVVAAKAAIQSGSHREGVSGARTRSRAFAATTTLGLSIALLLSACGFHPAGSRPLPDPLRKVYIDVVLPYRVSEPPLETSLHQRLVRQGARVMKDAASATATIKLTNLKEGRQVLSVGPDGKALEYLLVTTVDYELIDDGKPLLPPGHLRVTRDYSFNENQILAKEAEEARLREYIQDQLAEVLLIKLETLLPRQGKIVPVPGITAPPAAGSTLDAGPDSAGESPATPAPSSPAPAPATDEKPAPADAAPTGASEPVQAPTPQPAPVPETTAPP